MAQMVEKKNVPEIEDLLSKINYLFEHDQYVEIINLLPDNILDKYKNATLYSWRAYGHFRLKQIEKIFEYADKAISIDPKSPFPYRQRGNGWGLKEEFKKAIADYNKAIELKEDDAYAYSNRANVWYKIGQYNKAIADYNKAIELKKNESSFYHNRGMVKHSEKKYDEAISDYKAALKLNGNSANTFRNLGLVYYDKGDFENAIESYERAKEIDIKYKFLDYEIKLAKEKLEERKILEDTKANPSDITNRVKIEKQVELLIGKIRTLSKSEVKTVVHYTKVSVIDIYVKAKNVKMHYNNAIYMNDPMEGRLFFEYLDNPVIEQAYFNGEKRTETSVYIGSFLPAEENDGQISHEDELVMWRTYGKDENGKEAAGCSVVLSSDFFKVKILAEEHSSTDKRGDLLNVIYIKKHKNQKFITNDLTREMTPTLNLLKTEIGKLITLRDKYQPKEDFYKEIENSIFKHLSAVTYLFKSADYEYEHEARVITYMPRNSDSIKFREVKESSKPSKNFYIESYNDILPYIKKIYLGPKVEFYQHWSLYLDYEIRQRAKELEKLSLSLCKVNPSDIEIIKSENKFQ